MATFTDKEREYLNSQRLARLATANSNNAPHVVPVEQDVEDFPRHLLKDIEFIWVDRVAQVVAQALEPEPAARNGARPPAEARRRASVSRDGTATRRARAAQTARKPSRSKARSK
jgi:pyridoxamine 5'-phosphate oxidase-like protein